MLQAIRSKVGSWIVKILFFFLILSFAVWGIGDMMRDAPPDETVATIGDMAIESTQVETEFRNEIQRIRQNFGINLDTTTAARLGLLDDTLDRVVDEAVLAYAAARIGFNVPNEMLVSLLRNQPAFQDQAGNFSPARFQQTLAASGMSEEQYLNRMRQAVGRSQMLAPVASAATAPNTLVDDLFAFERERRDAQYMVFEQGAFGDIDSPDLLTLRQFHADNPDLFQAPAYRRLSAIVMSGETLAGDIDVGEREVESRYESQLDRYSTAERRSFRQVLVDDEETAEDLAEAARDSGSLEDAMASLGIDESVTPFAEQERSDIAFDVLADAVFSTSQGEFGTPVESPFGWHVFEVTDIVDDAVQPFDDVRDEIRREIQLDRALDRLFQDANRLEDALAAGLSLDEAADETGLSVEDLGFVDAEGRRPDESVVEDIPGAAEIIETGFSLDIGETSGLEDLQDNVFFVVRADEERPPETRPFDDVRDQVAEEWRVSERRRLMAEAAEAAHDAASSDPSAFSEIAAEHGARTESASDLRRDESHQTLSQSAVNDLFEASANDVLLAVEQDRALVIRVAAVHEADPDADAEALADIQDRVRNQIGNDLVSQFAMAWRGQFDVEINREHLLSRLGLSDVDLTADPDLSVDEGAMGAGVGDIEADGLPQPGGASPGAMP